MSFTRFNYDVARTEKQLQESTGPGRYMLCVPGQGMAPGIYEDPNIRIGKWGGNLMKAPSGHPIDIWSDLDGRNIKHQKYGRTHTGESDAQKVEYPVIRAYTNETRATHPAFMYRNMEVKRWDHLHENPQDHAILPDSLYESSRINQKKERKQYRK